MEADALPNRKKLKRRTRPDNEDLEFRIKALEDRKEIEDLKARYCYFIDNHDWSKVGNLFAEDGTIDCGPFGKASGREAVRTFFTENIGNSFSFFMHMVHNPMIEIRGNDASGTWYWTEPSTYKSDSLARWIGGRYDEQYVREGKGRWKFKSVVLNLKINTPFDKGWEKENQV